MCNSFRPPNLNSTSKRGLIYPEDDTRQEHAPVAGQSQAGICFAALPRLTALPDQPVAAQHQVEQRPDAERHVGAHEDPVGYAEDDVVAGHAAQEGDHEAVGDDPVDRYPGDRRDGEQRPALSQQQPDQRDQRQRDEDQRVGYAERADDLHAVFADLVGAVLEAEPDGQRVVEDRRRLRDQHQHRRQREKRNDDPVSGRAFGASHLNHCLSE